MYGLAVQLLFVVVEVFVFLTRRFFVYSEVLSRLTTMILRKASMMKDVLSAVSFCIHCNYFSSSVMDKGLCV